jgi:acetyl esterase/lipase
MKTDKFSVSRGSRTNALSWQARMYRVALRLGFKPFLKYGSIPVMRAYMRGFDRALSISSARLYDSAGFRVEGTEHGELVEPLEGTSQKVILYLPGGGFIVRSENAHQILVKRLCKAANASASIVHYRLAPEYPFPAAIDDAVAAYRDLLDRGTAPDRIVIAGDSAGGNLALATALALRDAGVPMPAGLAVISPVADLTFSGESRHSNRHRDPMLPADRSHADARHYIADNDPSHPLISPVFADFTGLPSILAQVGSDEILLDDSVRVGHRAKEAGVALELDVWYKMPHVWHLLPHLPESDLALADIADFISRTTGVD